MNINNSTNWSVRSDKKWITSIKSLYPAVIGSIIIIAVLIIMPLVFPTDYGMTAIALAFEGGSFFESGLSWLILIFTVILAVRLILFIKAFVTHSREDYKFAEIIKLQRMFAVAQVWFAVLYLIAAITDPIFNWDMLYWLASSPNVGYFVVYGIAFTVGNLLMIVPQIFCPELRMYLKRAIYEYATLVLLAAIVIVLTYTDLTNPVTFTVMMKGIIVYSSIIFSARKLFYVCIPESKRFGHVYETHKKWLKTNTMPISLTGPVTLCFITFAFMIVTAIGGGAAFGIISFIVSLVLAIYANYYNEHLLPGLIKNDPYKLSYSGDSVPVAESAAEEQAVDASDDESMPVGATFYDKYLSLNKVECYENSVDFAMLRNRLEDKIASKGVHIEQNEAHALLTAIVSNPIVIVDGADDDKAQKITEAISELFGGAQAFIQPQPRDMKSFEMLGQEEAAAEAPAVATGVDGSEALEEEQKPMELNAINPSVGVKALEEMGFSPVLIGLAMSEYYGDMLNVVALSSVDLSAANSYMSAIAEKMNTCSPLNVEVWNINYIKSAKGYEHGHLSVPENIRFILFTESAGVTSKSLAMASECVHVTATSCEKKYVEAVAPVSNTMLAALLDRAREEYGLSEEYWKRLDKLEAYLKETVGSGFSNKLLHKMEKHMAIELSCGAGMPESLDSMMARKLIPYLSSLENKLLRDKDNGLYAVIDGIFTMDNLPETKAAIKRYGLMK